MKQKVFIPSIWSALTTATFSKAFWISKHNWKTNMQLDYIWPVESNGDTPQILGWGCDILILASFEGVQSSTRRKHVRIKSFQTPYKHALRMTFLLQTQKLIMSNAWNLTKFIRGHDSKTSYFFKTITTLHIQCCRSSVFRVMTSDQFCQVPSIWLREFLCL